MKLLYTVLLSACFFSFANGQQLLSWTPEFPLDNSTVTITVDCAKGNQGLFNFEGGSSNNVYVHIGVITNLSTSFSDWRYVPFSWGTANAAAKATPLGNNKYSYTITNVRSFFGVPAGETIQKICVIYRNATGSLKQVNSDGSDMYVPVYNSGQLFARLNLPPREPRFVPWLEPITASVGSTITINGVSSIAANLTLKLNGTVVGTAANATTITATPTITTNCDQQITLEAENGGTVVTDIINFYIPPTTTTAPLPTGVQDGINYNSPTSVTLVLYAPGKNTVVAVGDFNSWTAGCAYQFNRTPDGNRFWLTLTGLTAGQIYRFQYLVDGTIRTTDPYTELVLDPWNDQYISSSTYPNMPQYPSGLATGIVGTFQPGATNYNWSSNAYTRPDKKNLVIYELLIRDFLAQNNWQTLTDTLNYLKNLGVSAIEIMPFTEFDGNNSWGYNPAFFFAPDKAYGPKNELKRFIDSAHSKGMAVILDAVLNHVTGQSPLAQLYWNSTSNQPSASNPWLNQTAPHPYSVFNDFNHSAEPTKYHVARFMRHWLTEYKLDGFRWDLSKGFTQTNCGSNVGCWNNYDASRVAIWQRYYDSSQVVSPGSFMILEHLGNDDEEADLAGRGMMLWGKMTNEYNQNTMGFASSSSIDRALYTNRSFWNQPHLVAYAESHDEERLMYKNLNFGNSSNTSYDVKTLSVALRQMEAMQPMLLLIPGPKMIWEFGELGYDKSIFMCENGTIPQPYGTETCKTAPKPPMWNYFQEAGRKKIYDVIAKLNALRKLKPALFTTNTVTTGTNLGNDLRKTLVLSNADIKLVAVSNFDVTQQTFNVTFPQTGLWYEYFTGATLNVTTSPYSLTFAPGEYHVWTTMAPCQTPAPTGTTPVVYCQGTTATPLTATGTSLLWYTTATGGTGSATAPTPATTTAGSTSYYVSQTLNGCEGPRLEIVVTINATPAAPTVTTPITYCQNATASQLTATGSSLLWYTVASGGTGSTTAPTPSTTVAGTNTYYVSQTINGCEGPRASIVVNVAALPAAPVVSTPVNYCQGATATALTASGTNLLWYTVPSGGTGSATAPTPSTASVGSVTYYVSQTINSCEGPRASIVVNVNAIPAAPIVTSPVTYCQGATAVALTATGTNLLWYTSATGGTGNSTAPTPSTANIGSNIYYVSQTVNGCESPRSAITVTITASTPAPTVTSPVNYCQGSTASALTATGTSLLWYTVASGGTGSPIAPIPSTASVGATSYWVSQTLSCGEGPRAEIVVNVFAVPLAPVVTSPIAYCQGATASQLTATGTNLLWYTSATGGTGVSIAPTPSTATAGSVSYYVSQTVNGCESPRASIVVNVNATPSAPIVTTPVNYCQNATSVPLTATGTNLLWYTTVTGGTGSATAPTPSTVGAGITTYYVSQTINACESPRASIAVVVTAIPSAPVVTTPVVYCQGAVATQLTATGTGLLWYTTPVGGTGSSTGPTPSTTNAGSTFYYVSQTGTCGESPRAAITVTVNTTPGAPVVSSPVTYCQGTSATVLTATGSNLLWYTSATGGTGSTTAPTPSTSTTGTTIYYVTQTANGCESPMAAIAVTVNITPNAPGVTSPVTYCQNATATPLTATGTNLLWYNVPSGGTGSVTVPTPQTNVAGSTTYYVSQSTGTCEGPRSAIVVTVNPLPALPAVTSPVSYCEKVAAVPLTATGTGLLWFTTASGGTGTATAPTPSTASVGTFTYYVAQTNACGEGPRASIVVNITTGPTAPTGLSVTGITMTSAVLNWTNISGYYYKIEYKASGATTWTTLANGSTSNSYTVTGLTKGQAYDWRVSANCDAAGSNNNFATAQFTTLDRNTEIANVRNGIGIKLSPNPVFNYSSVIDYIVPEAGAVSFTVLNEAGQRVYVFSKTVTAAGQYQIDFKPNIRLAQGFYILQIMQNGKTNYVTFIKR